MDIFIEVTPGIKNVSACLVQKAVAKSPVSRQIFTFAKLKLSGIYKLLAFSGGADICHAMRKNSGAAKFLPIKAGFGVPSKLPNQTTSVYSQNFQRSKRLYSHRKFRFSMRF